MVGANRVCVLALTIASVWLAACKADAPVSEKTDPRIARRAPKAELHVIGLHAGVYPAGTDTRPWWEKCGPLGGNTPPSAECHQRYAGLRTKGFAIVNVTYTGAPVILALMGEDPIEWTVGIGPSAKVEKVILAGTSRQEIAGIDPAIPIEVHGPHFSCERCSQIGRGFAAHDENTREYVAAMRRLKEITGRSPSSIQLARQAGGAFYVSSTLTRYSELPDAFRTWEVTQ